MPQLTKAPWGPDYIDPSTLVSIEVFHHGPEDSRPFVRLRLAKNGAGFELKSPCASSQDEAQRWAQEIVDWQTSPPYR